MNEKRQKHMIYVSDLRWKYVTRRGRETRAGRTKYGASTYINDLIEKDMISRLSIPERELIEAVDKAMSGRS